MLIYRLLWVNENTNWKCPTLLRTVSGIRLKKYTSISRSSALMLGHRQASVMCAQRVHFGFVKKDRKGTHS